MRILFRCTAAAVLAASLVVVTVSEANAGHSRENHVVSVVKKASASIVTLKVMKHGAYSKREVIGTGVIVDERGYVVTNRHVVSGGESIVAVLADGSDTSAEVVFEDQGHDIAVVKLPSGKTYQELAFGPASDLLVGEEVVAIGHPFGYSNTVSTGIISALGRELTMPTGESLTNLIQTDASLNPGNSGGPLLNINGELIGINVAIHQEGHGIAFALNSDMVQQVLAQHLSAGKIAHVAHGLTCHEVVADEDGNDRVHVVVDDVASKSPAAAAGLKKGDVLLEVDHHRITNRFDLERAMWRFKAGDEVTLALGQDDKKGQMTTTTASLTLCRGDGERTAAEPIPEVKWDMTNIVTPVSDQK